MRARAGFPAMTGTVGVAGFEPATSCSRSRGSTDLMSAVEARETASRTRILGRQAVYGHIACRTGT
jgi:hypothetical protein